MMSATDTVSLADASRTSNDSWPHVMPEVGRALTTQQELACAFRILAHAGFGLDIAGHITWLDETTGNMWANPWGKWWEEVQASDILLVSPEGDVLDGKWDVTPAIHIHTELHRQRPDARVIVHNHPYYATLLATVHQPPQITEQQACMFDGEIGFYDEYTGGIDNAADGARLAAALDGVSVALLANHGAMVMGPDIAVATYKAVTFERMCRLNHDAMVAGREPVPLAPEVRRTMKEGLLRYSSVSFWRGAVRQLIAREPDVLD